MNDPVNRRRHFKVDKLLARLGSSLWPSKCLLCEASGGGTGWDLCDACLAAWPWNRSACRRCALPVPVAPGGGRQEGIGRADVGAGSGSGSSADAGQQGAQPMRTVDPIAAGDRICGACLNHASPLTEVHAACRYGAPLDRLLPRLKFHRDLAAGRLLAATMADAFAALPTPSLLVPLPLHWRRLRQRGYDQTLELARPLARKLRIGLNETALVRIRDTAAQSELDAEQRQRNLRNAFAVRAGAALPAHVALVDDVMTTGATLHAAAQALRRAGVQRVDAWVCARVL